MKFLNKLLRNVWLILKIVKKGIPEKFSGGIPEEFSERIPDIYIGIISEGGEILLENSLKIFCRIYREFPLSDFAKDVYEELRNF